MWLSTPASFKYPEIVSATPNLNRPSSVTINAFFAPRFCALVLQSLLHSLDPLRETFYIKLLYRK
jgi:hypothetical protein